MRSICTAVVATLALVGTSFAATINVPGDQPTIAAAISASSDGDVIAIAAGTYYEHSLSTGGKAITIGSASGNLDVTIDAQQGGSVFMVTSGETSETVIKDLVITGGNGTDLGGFSVGGGIFCEDSSPTISDCTISGNTANVGGGIYCENSNPTISNCTIEGNTAYYGGGIYCWDSNPTISDCTISGNTAASDDGGGIYCDNSNPTINDCTISNNTANYGGGIYSAGSSPTITDCTISDNIASTSGGGIYCASSPRLLDSTVCGNSPNQIEGAYSDEGGNTVAGVCPIPGACCTNGECVIAEQADCLAFHGTWLGEGTTCDDSSCPTACLGDVTGDGQVNVNDLLTLLANWGPCP